MELYIKTARLPEVLLICGAPFLGVLITIPDLTLDSVSRASYVLTGILALAIHVYLFNAWAGHLHDHADPSRRGDPILRGLLEPKKTLVASFVLLGISLAIFLSLSVFLFLIALGKAILWCLYAHPRVAIKGIPIVPTFFHVVGGTLAVYLSCAAMEGFTLGGIWIGLYFGLVLAGGHLNHELLNREADRMAGYRTSAIRFGKKPVFLAGFIVFSLSTFYFCWLALAGFLPKSLAPGLLAAYPLHCAFVLSAYKAGISTEALLRLRRGYRALYAAVGLYMTSLLLAAKIF